MVDAGRLDTRIVIKSKGETLSALGELNHQTLTTVATVWAAVVRVSAVEIFLAGGDASLDTVKWRIRFRSGITENDVIESNGRTYDITGIVPAGASDRQWLIITARGQA